MTDFCCDTSPLCEQSVRNFAHVLGEASILLFSGSTTTHMLGASRSRGWRFGLAVTVALDAPKDNGRESPVQWFLSFVERRLVNTSACESHDRFFLERLLDPEGLPCCISVPYRAPDCPGGTRD